MNKLFNSNYMMTLSSWAEKNKNQFSMQTNQFRADSTHSSPTFQQPLQNNSEHYPSSPDFLPDFKVSNVIAKNEHIQILEEEQHKPLDHFFNRMNQLGYEANNVSQTFVIETENFQQQSQKQKSEKKQRQSNDNFGNNESSPALQSKFTIDQRFRSKIKHRVEQLDLLISNLNSQKFNIVDSIREYQQQETLIMRQISKRIEEKIEEVTFEQQNRITELEGQLDIYVKKCRELEENRHLDQLESGHLSKDVEEIHETNRSLNQQLDQIQAENNELKYQLRQSQIHHKTVEELEEQIANLNKTLDENGQYIFDLEQKVAGASLEMEVLEVKLKKQYEHQAEEERQRMEVEYKAEFEKVQEEMEKRIANQLEEQYHSSLQKMKITHEEQIVQLRKEHREQIDKMEKEKMELVKINREYEIKLHETEQEQLKLSETGRTPVKTIDFSRELENSRLTNESLERKLREKEEEIKFYKDKAVKPQTKNNNILVIDQHQHSFQREAISPSSSLAALYHHNPSTYTPSSRDDKINTILSRIRVRQSGSILSNLNDQSMSRQYPQVLNTSNFRPVSPESMILQKEKDMRMRNISHKLQQLRADIRREIGMIHH